MPERTDAYAYFWIQGYTCSPDEVSERLRLNPTSMRRIGDIQQYGPPAKLNRWEMLSPLPRGNSLHQEHLEALFTLLEPSAGAILEFSTHCQAGINCVGYYYGTNPGLHLSAALLARLNALGLAVDFDLYNYREEDAP